MSNFKKYMNMYTFNTILPGSGEKVEFSPIKTKQMKNLLMFEDSEDPDTLEKAIDNIMIECVSSEDFDVNDLYIQDRFHLMLEIRKKTKGESYKFDYTCNECKSQSIQNIDLTKLKTTKLEVTSKPKQSSKVKTKSTSKTKKPVDVVEINDNISVRLEHIKRGFQAEAFNIVNDMGQDLTENQKLVEASTITYAMTIKGIITPDGEDEGLSLEERVFFINNITQEEYEKMLSWFDENDFGTEFEYDAVCPHCKHKEHIDIPMENFFF